MELGTERTFKWALAILVVFGLVGTMFALRMATVLKFLLIVNCIVLIGTILLQAGKGGGLAAIGGLADQSTFGTRTSTFLSKLTYFIGAVLLVSTICLTRLSTMKVVEKAPVRPTTQAPTTPPGHPPIEKKPAAAPPPAQEKKETSPALGWKEERPPEGEKPTGEKKEVVPPPGAVKESGQ